jgi:hypothetical protein
LTSATLPLSQCRVEGVLTDNAVPIGSSEINFFSEPFLDNGGNSISINETVVTDALGNFQVNLVPTAPYNKTVQVSVDYVDTSGVRQARKYRISVPDQATALISDIIA